MEGAKSAEPMSPRISINNRLRLVQEDLNNVEKRLTRIIEELLGPRLSPDSGALKEESVKAKGWLDRITLRLGDFSSQLRRIKKLESDLEKSIIGSSENTSKERGEPTTEEC